MNAAMKPKETFLRLLQQPPAGALVPDPGLAFAWALNLHPDRIPADVPGAARRFRERLAPYPAQPGVAPSRENR